MGAGWQDLEAKKRRGERIGAGRPRAPTGGCVDGGHGRLRAHRPTLAHTDPGSVLRRSSKPAENFGRMFWWLGENKQRIPGSYFCERRLEVDQDDGPTEMRNANNTAVFGPGRLHARFW